MQPRSPLTACQRTDLAPTAQPATFAASAPLSAFFTVLATNIDRAGRSFVSVVEATDPRLRIYATQFHPEKRAAYVYIARWGPSSPTEMYGRRTARQNSVPAQ